MQSLGIQSPHTGRRPLPTAATRVILAFVCISVSGCRASHSSELQSPGAPLPAKKPPVVVRHSKVVAYKFLKNVKPMKSASFTTIGGNLSVVVKPSDFNSAPVECNGDICQATLIEPIVVNATIPTPLRVKIKVDYRKTRKPEEALFSHKLAVGGQFTLVDLGDILNVSAQVMVNLEARPEDKYRPRITQVECSKCISCETPLFVLSGSIDKTGIKFGGRLVVSERWTSSDKILVDQLQRDTLITYDQIVQQEWFQKLPLLPGTKKEDYDELWTPDSQDDKRR